MFLRFLLASQKSETIFNALIIFLRLQVMRFSILNTNLYKNYFKTKQRFMELHSIY